MKNVQISIKFSANVYEETSIPLVEQLNILAAGDVMLTSYFCVCKLWVLPIRQTSDQMLGSQQELCSRKFVLHVSGQ